MDIIGERSMNADWEEMRNLNPQTIRAFDCCSVLEPAENTGDLRPSFYGYYYF
jgi:hypothetical protein